MRNCDAQCNVEDVAKFGVLAGSMSVKSQFEQCSNGFRENGWWETEKMSGTYDIFWVAWKNSKTFVIKSHYFFVSVPNDCIATLKFGFDNALFQEMGDLQVFRAIHGQINLELEIFLTEFQLKPKLSLKNFWNGSDVQIYMSFPHSQHSSERGSRLGTCFQHIE